MAVKCIKLNKVYLQKYSTLSTNGKKIPAARQSEHRDCKLQVLQDYVGSLIINQLILDEYYDDATFFKGSS